MIVFESRKSRAVLARLERGEDLVTTLETLARRERVRAAWIRGLGTLEWAELDRHDQARRTPEPPQRFDAPCEILTLEGNVSMIGGAPRALIHVTLARRTDNGVEVLGGRLRAGAVFAVELVLECFEDLTLTRVPDDQTGLALWVAAGERAPSATGPRLEPEEAIETADEEDGDDGRVNGVSWADVAAVSAAPPIERARPRPERRPRPSSSEPPLAGLRASPIPPPIPGRRRADADAMPAEELQPQKGDWIDHRQFGVCRVEREDEEGGIVIRLPSGVRKTIKLDFMDVGQARDEGNRRVFPLRPRRR